MKILGKSFGKMGICLMLLCLLVMGVAGKHIHDVDRTACSNCHTSSKKELGSRLTKLDDHDTPVRNGKTETRSCPNTCPECRNHLECPNGVKVVRDDCGCCLHCALQQGEECNPLHICDQGLFCVNGTCHDKHPLACKVGSKVYQDGDVWKPNCQTMCQCQNAMFGCTDVCQPDKDSADCSFGRKLIVESECCSRWVCQEAPAHCPNITTNWTECSCSTLLSHQWSNHNPECQWMVQQRSCPPEKCQDVHPVTSTNNVQMLFDARKHCSASLYHRYEYIAQDNCRSTRMYHQKTCASECHLPDQRKVCCVPNEFVSMPVRLKCSKRKVVLRTLAVIAGCACDLC